MHSKGFHDLFLKSSTERLTKENSKEIILLGDFKTDLAKSTSNANASEFLDVIYSNNLLSHITSPNRLRSRSHTIIDNIISNINEECTSGYIRSFRSISYYSKLFLLMHLQKSDFKNFKEQNFISDLKK